MRTHQLGRGVEARGCEPWNPGANPRIARTKSVSRRGRVGAGKELGPPQEQEKPAEAVEKLRLQTPIRPTLTFVSAIAPGQFVADVVSRCTFQLALVETDHWHVVD
jgi:hypothetical protein